MENQEMFYRDTWVEVDLDCIAENVRQTKKRLPKEVQLIAVVKANGYGHGDVQVAKTALEEGATYLAVALLDEAMALRQKGIDAPILVLGATRAEDVILAAENKITLTVFQVEWLKNAKQFLKEDSTISIHIKIDSGMGRIGVRSQSELKAIEALITEDKRFYLEGAYTHFATADELDSEYFHQQLDNFNKMVASFTQRPKLIHASNSAATLRKPEALFNGIRFGIAMYGLTPSVEIENDLPFPLKEAFSLRTRLIHVKKLAPGDKVSYGATYEAKKEEWIGTLPIGYADGWIRRLQGQEVLVEGIRAPIVGRICMDQCMIKLPYKLAVGTVVTLIGSNQSETISVNEIAKRLETINYEIPCIISSRVPRVYKKSGKNIDIHNPILNQ